jgi:hypothetical protein
MSWAHPVDEEFAFAERCDATIGSVDARRQCADYRGIVARNFHRARKIGQQKIEPYDD